MKHVPLSTNYPNLCTPGLYGLELEQVKRLITGKIFSFVINI
jgi:hypothetical protein